jgi:hypothetical protein
MCYSDSCGYRCKCDCDTVLVVGYRGLSEGFLIVLFFSTALEILFTCTFFFRQLSPPTHYNTAQSSSPSGRGGGGGVDGDDDDIPEDDIDEEMHVAEEAEEEESPFKYVMFPFYFLLAHVAFTFPCHQHWAV